MEAVGDGTVVLGLILEIGVAVPMDNNRTNGDVIEKSAIGSAKMYFPTRPYPTKDSRICIGIMDPWWKARTTWSMGRK